MKSIAFDMVSGDKGFEVSFEACKKFLKLNKDYKIYGFVTKDIDLTNKKLNNLEYVICEQKINQDDGPMQVRRKSNSTLVKAINYAIENKVQAVVSSAASGPYIIAGYLFSKTIIESIKPAFSPIISSINGSSKIAIDVGANIGANPETLYIYAKMGTEYAKALGISENPRVRLLNIGSEEKKGPEILVQTHKLLKESKDINFLGNLEANEILLNNEDVVLSEAVMGNVALKSYEGAFNVIKSTIKNSAKKSFFTKIGLLFAFKLRKDLKLISNSDDVGGAIILGLNHLLIKSHGGSDFKYLFNSLVVAKKLVDKNMMEKIKKVYG